MDQVGKEIDIKNYFELNDFRIYCNEPDILNVIIMASI